MKSGKSASAPVPGESLYQLGGHWRGVDGTDFRLATLRGRTVVLTMAYTECKASCPLIISKLKEIESGAGDAAGKIAIVVASFDPKRDVPAHLAEFAANRKLDPRRWIFLSPMGDADVRELAAVLGISYSRDEDGEVSHSNAIVLLNSDGVVVSRVSGLSASHEELVQKLKKDASR